MSLTGALNAAVSGLGANQKQMQVISGNVSNAGVEGYTRKTAAQSTNLVGTSTNGGVQVENVRREVDEFLVGRLRRAESDLSFEQTKSDFFSRIQNFFGQPGDDTALSNTINNLRQSIEDLAINPENSAGQALAVQKLQEVTSQFQDFSQQTQDLRAEADVQLDLSIEKVNENLREIKELNAQIAQATGANQSAAELKDKRDIALKELSSQIDINTFERDTGETVVLSDDSASRTLVDGFAEQLTFNAAGSLGSGENGGSVQFQNGDTVTAENIGGRTGALLQLRDQDLPNFQADLDRLAAQMREEMNEVHNLAATGNQPQPSGQALTGEHAFATSAQTVISRAITNPGNNFDTNSEVNTNNRNVANLTVQAGGASFNVPAFNTNTQTLTGLATAINGNSGFNASVNTLPSGDSFLQISNNNGQPVTFSGADSDFASQNLNLAATASNEIQGASGTVDLVPVNTNGNVASTPASISLNLGTAFSDAAGTTNKDLRDVVGQLNKQVNTAAGSTVDPFSLNSSGQLQISDPFGGSDFIVRQNPDNPATISSSNLAPTADPDGDGNGTRNFSHFFGLNNVIHTPDQNARDANGNSLPQPVSNPNLVTGDTNSAAGGDARTGSGVSAATTIQVNQSIANSPEQLARISPGQTPGQDPLPIGNSTVTQKLANVFDESVQFAAPKAFESNATGTSANTANLTQNTTGGNVGSRNVTLSNFAGDLLQFQAGRTSQLSESVKAKEGVQEQLQLRADTQSGVNIDQELANLTNFQQAFNANARVISTVDEMFDTLNRMAR